MNYRLATILERETHTADYTRVIDIDVQDPISRFLVVWEPTTGAVVNAMGHPVLGITKIELVDGSEVLYSLNGAEGHGVDWYHNKQEPANAISYLNGMTSIAIVNMNFGKFLYDPVHAFDPKKFSNPQLKITLDIDAGGAFCETGTLTVMAHLFDQKEVSPTGFLMHKEIKSFALANDSHEYTDLPTDYPYRKLFIRAQRYGTPPNEQIANVKLSEDVDKKVPLNHSLDQLLQAIISQTRPYRETILAPADTSARNMYCTPTVRPHFTAAQWRTTPFSSYESIFEGSGGRFTIKGSAAGPNTQIHCEGYCPHGIIEIPFGLQDDPADWYDVTGIGNLKLDITGGSSVGTGQTCEIFLQQLRNY